MKETVEARAVEIAARMMQAAGFCRHESPMQCRRVCTDGKTCEKCIERWLLNKAKKELEAKYGK